MQVNTSIPPASRKINFAPEMREIFRGFLIFYLLYSLFFHEPQYFTNIPYVQYTHEQDVEITGYPGTVYAATKYPALF